MPKRLPITPKDRKRIFKLYAQGQTPSEVARSLRDLNITARQVTNLVCREGWAKRKAEIAEVKSQSAEEVLAQVRRDNVASFKMFVESMAGSLEVDAEKLKDAWHLVENAADASALMRAKKLLLERGMATFGLDRQTDDGGNVQKAALAIVFCQPLNEPDQARPVDLEDDDSDSDDNGEVSAGAEDLDFA